MSELNLLTNLDAVELGAFRIVKAIIFFYGLWHLLKAQLHLRETMTNVLRVSRRFTNSFDRYDRDIHSTT